MVRSRKRPIHVIIGTGAVPENLHAGRSIAGPEAPPGTNPTGFGGEFIKWQKSSSRKMNLWKTPCGVSSARYNRKTSSRRSRNIVSI